MYIPKRYGQGRTDYCPFCKQQATVVNKQGIPVCIKHKNSMLNDVKCACGSWLELRAGKFGSYFNCMKCGNVSFSKAMEFHEIKEEKKTEEIPEKKIAEKTAPKETIIRSDELDFF